MKISNDTVNFLSDTFDEIISNYYIVKNGLNLDNVGETQNIEIKVTYLDAIYQVLNAYMDDQEINVTLDFEPKLHEFLEKLDEWFENHEVNTEEIRKSFLLLIIKGFKHAQYSLDLITPDAVGMILVHLVDSYTANDKKIKIIDPNAGSGNLIFLLNNYLDKELEFTAIEIHEGLANLISALANFSEIKVDVMLQDALNQTYSDQTILVTDVAAYEYDTMLYDSYLANKGVKYFPYLLIEKYLSVDKPIKKQMYLIDHDFFEQPGSELFKQFLKEHAYIKSLITLPSTYFQTPDFTKGILILEPLDEQQTHKTNVYMLPSIKEEKNFKQVLNKIKEDLKN